MATGPIETHLHRSFNWENGAPGPQEGPRGRSANCGNGLSAQCVRLRSEINPLLGSAREMSISFASRFDKPSIAHARDGQKRAHQTRRFFSLSSPAAAPSLTLPYTDRNVPK